MFAVQVLRQGPRNISSQKARNQVLCSRNNFTTGKRFLAESIPETDEVLVEEAGNTKKILLNRPKALNALSLPMIRKLTPLYSRWEKEGSNNTVVIMKGAGDKAFCAGGDIRAIYDDGKAGHFGRGSITSDFFYEEYNLNHKIAEKKLTSIALLNGITMGGGVGLSVHGQYRVATEKTVFAMPETGIGFFPDVGGSYFLPRLKPDGLGMYLGLTGARLKGEDLVIAGIATHFVKHEYLNELESKLGNASVEKIPEVLNSFNAASTNFQSELTRQMETISKIFNRYDIEAIFSALEEASSKDEWAKGVLETLKKMSPTSLRVVTEQLKRGSNLDYKGCFEMEYNISQGFMRGKDFFEGVRATLVDKDKNPKWSPPSIHEITQQQINEEYFRPAQQQWSRF